MSISTPVCQHCEQPLKLTGEGENVGQYICENTICPDKHSNIKCPECGSNKTSSRKVGSGKFRPKIYECKNCSYVWEDIEYKKVK